MVENKYFLKNLSSKTKTTRKLAVILLANKINFKDEKKLKEKDNTITKLSICQEI